METGKIQFFSCHSKGFYESFTRNLDLIALSYLIGSAQGEIKTASKMYIFSKKTQKLTT